MPVSRKVRLAAEAEASKLGASVSFQDGAKHVICTVTFKGQSRKTTLGRTAIRTKVDNLQDWVRQNIRKLVKDIQCNMAKPSN